MFTYSEPSKCDCPSRVTARGGPRCGPVGLYTPASSVDDGHRLWFQVETDAFEGDSVPEGAMVHRTVCKHLDDNHGSGGVLAIACRSPTKRLAQPAGIGCGCGSTMPDVDRRRQKRTELAADCEGSAISLVRSRPELRPW